ncbi:MAG: hypothetical protein WDO73_20560 [Ignavibacteriota bacterium]
MAKTLRNPDSPVAASGKYFRILGLSICSVAIAWSAVRDMDLEKQLEAAIHREIVVGDLAGAMKEYRTILSQQDVPRTLVSARPAADRRVFGKAGTGAGGV